MKKIKVLITLSLTLLVLVVGSISVFAVDIDGNEYIHYIYQDDITSLPDVVDVTPFRVYCRNVDSDQNLQVYYGANLEYYTVFFSNLQFNPDGYIDQLSYYSGQRTITVYRSSQGWLSYSYQNIYVPKNSVFIYQIGSELINQSDDRYIVIDSWYRSLLTLSSDVPTGSGLAEDIFELFQSIIAWMVGFFGVFVGLFWTSTSGLTVLGVFAVIALGISIFFLIFAVVINFFRFRGR